MFDADHVIVAGQAQRAGNLAPDNFIMSPSNGAEKPGTVRHLAITFCVQHSVARDILRVEGGIFCVHVKNTIAERADGDRNIRTLPEEMAGIKIYADIFSSGFA